MDVSDLRYRADNLLVLEEEVEVQGLGEDRVLGAERYDRSAVDIGFARIIRTRILATRILATRILATRILATRILATRILATRILASAHTLPPSERGPITVVLLKGLSPATS